MEKEYLPVHVFNTQGGARDAVRALGLSGFDVRKLFLADEGPEGSGDPVDATGGSWWARVRDRLLAPKVGKYVLMVCGEPGDAIAARALLAGAKVCVEG